MTQQPVSAAAPEGTVGKDTMPANGPWGWYQDHNGDAYRRVSNMVKKVETDTYNLDQWLRRQVGEGLAIRDDLVLAIKAMGRPPAEGWSREDKKKLDGIMKDASEAAKQRDGAKVGTAHHDLTERLDRGEALEDVVRGLPATPAQSVRAYEFLLRANNWSVVEIERTVLCSFTDPETGAEDEIGGSLDRVYEVPGLTAMLGPWTCQHGHHHGADPSRVIGDVKTEAAPWLNGLHIGPQLGIYSRARKMWRRLPGERTFRRGDRDVTVPNGEYVEAPCVRQDVAVVVHVHDGQAHPYFVNLTEGWGAAEAAYAQAKRESRAGRKLGAHGAWFVPMPGIKEPAPAQLITEQAAAANYADPYRPGPGLAAMPPRHAVGDVVTVGGIPFTKHSEGPTGFEQVAVRDPASGLVSFVPATPTNVAAADAALGAAGEVVKAKTPADGLRAQLIEQIWKTESVGGLGVLWNMAKDRGVPWTGPVAMAGDARRRIIECVQRPLHVPSATGMPVKCACGWTSDVRP